MLETMVMDFGGTKMVLTITDGRIRNAITLTSSTQIFYVCGGASTQMNHTDKTVEKNVTIYRFTPCTLHMWITYFSACSTSHLFEN
jgi:hypothetical protein